MGKKIIRVFPRGTKATPTDDLVRVNCGPELWDEADEVHISVSFTWDLPRAEWLAKQWEHVAPVKIGGPATGERGENFTPGMYLKKGYVITSRGCPNRCWFCSVPKREGDIRELPITEGWNVLDDNLLACSWEHIAAVFNMLDDQKRPVEFTGGLEAARFKPWMVESLKELRVKQMFFAYDTPDDYEPLRAVAGMLTPFFTRHHLRAYVLIGYPKDTPEMAESRLKSVMDLGIDPMAMLWKDDTGKQTKEWKHFQRAWARPAIMHRRAA